MFGAALVIKKNMKSIELFILVILNKANLESK